MKEQCKRQWKHWVKFFCKAMVMVGLPVCMAALALGAYLQTTTGVLVATDKPCQFVNPQAVAAAFISGDRSVRVYIGRATDSEGTSGHVWGRGTSGDIDDACAGCTRAPLYSFEVSPRLINMVLSSRPETALTLPDIVGYSWQVPIAIAGTYGALERVRAQ